MFVPADLSLLDGVCRSLFKQLNGLVVVQSAAAPNHVAEELHAVQLPVRVLGSGVVHQADLTTGSCSTKSAKMFSA